MVLAHVAAGAGKLGDERADVIRGLDVSEHGKAEQLFENHVHVRAGLDLDFARISKTAQGALHVAAPVSALSANDISEYTEQDCAQDGRDVVAVSRGLEIDGELQMLEGEAVVARGEQFCDAGFRHAQI